MNYEISKLTRISRFIITMIWIFTFIVFTICVRSSDSLEGYYQPPKGSSVWGYFTPPLLYRVPTRTHQTAMDAMVDLTNNLGVTILKDHSYSKGNFAFSPYGMASVLVVLYEGACGESASQIHRAIGFPFDKDVIRVGFRNIHRHLRSYFSHEGYLSGISLNKEGSALKPEFKRILKFYGYNVDVNHPVDEDIGLEDLTSPASPSGGAITNSNVTSLSPSGVSEDDNQSMSHANTTKGSDGNKEKRKDVNKVAGEKTTKKPDEKEDKPDETGDDHGKDKETAKPDKRPENDVSAEGSKKKPDKTSDVESAERGKETPDKATEDANDSSEKEDEKPADSETDQNNKNEMENSDKTSAEKVGGVEENKENSDVTGEDANDNSSNAEKEGADDTANAKETGNSDKTSTQDSDAADEDKQNSEDGNDSSKDTADGQGDNKETENSDKAPEDHKTSQEDKGNFDSVTEDQSQVTERENEKVCAGKEDCENKTENSTTTTAKQEPEEMSITTLSDGLVLNKTEPTEEVEGLEVTSSTIKNSDENSENSETGVPTPETESEDNMSENLESPLTSTMDPSQEEEVTKMTESSDSEKTTTKANLDNGMLIPQPDDLPTSSEPSTTEEGNHESTTSDTSAESQTDPSTTEEGNHESTTSDTSSESKTDATEKLSHAEVTTSKPHSRRKRNPSVQEKLRISNRLRPMNKISVWGQMKLGGVKPSRPTRQAFHPKLSALYRVRNERTITDYLKWPPASDVSLQLQNGMFDSHVSRNLELYKSLPRIMFLVDGAIDTPVPMMTYTHRFPYAYIPRLHTKALEFPLDDVRYKLLILLPVERRGLRQLIYDLTEFPLREVFTALQPTRVRAMIPPFMVEGFVILTSSLQKLGIWDVFDPRKSNLSGMSIDPELYVRNVEQSVTVVIRNYVEILDIQTRTMAARNIEHDFEATHPFLYFVLDTATNVALMAGQILDPLNSRIY